MVNLALESRPVPGYLMRYERTPSTFDDSILKPCFEARTLMKRLMEWACHLKAFIISGGLTPPARQQLNGFITHRGSSFRKPSYAWAPDVPFLRVALGFHATLAVPAGSGLSRPDPRCRHLRAIQTSWSVSRRVARCSRLRFRARQVIEEILINSPALDKPTC